MWEKNLESSEYQNKFFAKLQRATRKPFYYDSKHLFLQAWVFLVLHLFAFCFLCKYLLTAFYKCPWIIRQQERKQKIISYRLALNKNSFQGNFHFTVIFIIQCFFLTSNSRSRSNASFGGRPCFYQFFRPDDISSLCC